MVCLSILMVLSSCGCGGGGGGALPPADNNPPLPPYNIYGVVKDNIGRVVRDADVSASYKGEESTVLDEDKTDELGKYYLWVPVAKDKIYVVTASKTGYQTEAKEVQLSPPDYQAEVNFYLTPVGKR